jgi:hypothetical protein
MGSALRTHLDSLSPEEKRALADYLWREADAQPAPDLSDCQAQQLDARAADALKDSSKRLPLGDAEAKLQR